jgi:hypothetical protein
MNISNEAQLRSEVTRGQRALELLENELLIEAFTTIDENLTEAWKNLPDGQEGQLEKLWITQKLLKSLRGHIESVALTGKMASLTLEANRSIAQKLKDSLASLY